MLNTLKYYKNIIFDKNTPFLPKALLVIASIYLVSPFDISPDFIPLSGWVDDFIIIPLLVTFATKLVPETVKKAHDKEKEN